MDGVVSFTKIPFFSFSVARNRGRGAREITVTFSRVSKNCIQVCPVPLTVARWESKKKIPAILLYEY